MTDQDNDNDEHIAAASLLALVGSQAKSCPVPRVEEVTTSSEIEDEGKKEQNGGHSIKILPYTATSQSSDDGSTAKVSEDESIHKSFLKSSKVTSVQNMICSPRRHTLPAGTTSNSFPNTKKTGGKSQVPEVLMKVLTSNRFLDTMCFLPDNNKFIIASSKKFTDEIMPHYFQMTKFGCFLNKLERWGFTHAALKDQQHLFYHPYFRKNDLNLLRRIQYTPTRTESTSASMKRRRGDHNILEYPSPKRISGLSTSESFHHALNLRAPTIKRSRSQECGIDLNQISPTSSCDSHLKLSSSFMSMSTTEVNNATKDIVAKAIDCLLYDEGHTMDLLARRGQELQARRLSLPSIQATRTKSRNFSLSSLK